MNDGRYKRLVLAILFVAVLLGVVIVLLFAVLNKPKDVQINNYVGKDGKSIMGPAGQSIVGPQGPTGIAVNGKDGTNAETIINNITTNVPIPGPQGDTGPAGAPTPQLLIKLDPVTCKLLTKYDGDDFWQALAQLPKPCEAGNE